MTADIESLVLEQLRLIRAKVDKIELGMDELKWRMTSLEHAMLSVRREVLTCADVDDRQQKTLDFLWEKIQRIEKRLELGE